MNNISPKTERETEQKRAMPSLFPRDLCGLVVWAGRDKNQERQQAAVQLHGLPGTGLGGDQTRQDRQEARAECQVLALN